MACQSCGCWVKISSQQFPHSQSCECAGLPSKFQSRPALGGNLNRRLSNLHIGHTYSPQYAHFQHFSRTSLLEHKSPHDIHLSECSLFVLRGGVLACCVCCCITTPLPALPDDCPGVLGPAGAGVVLQPLDLDRLLGGSVLGPGGSMSCLRGGWSLG